MFQGHESIPQFPSASPSAPDFHGFLMRRSASYSGAEVPPEDDMSDDGSQFQGEKKRRLDVEQVRALEKSFELGNKLEPERKMELARALGLQPRQIAIWFQNRRARSKTKQLEKDYDVLKRQFEALKADNDSLKSQNKNLQSQILSLKKRESLEGAINLNRETEGSWSNATADNTGAAALLFSPTMAHGGGGFTELLHGSTRRNNPSTPAGSEGLCNFFGGIEENPGFWPWTDQQNFH